MIISLGQGLQGKLTKVYVCPDGYYIVLFSPLQWGQIHQYEEIRTLNLSFEEGQEHDKYVVKMTEQKYDRYLEIQTAINDLGNN